MLALERISRSLWKPIQDQPDLTGDKFRHTYLSLVNSTFVHGNAGSGMVGVPGTEIFTFNAKRAGNTEVNMLMLRLG